jgi:pimeloyl-ACP methyl ester carboxylesterase
LALHESPRSSLSMIPVIEALTHRFHVIAPDTPGYGLSSPLPQDAPSLDDFVEALVALLDDFGVARAAVYGTHTGATLALAPASGHPARVSALVLDGISAFDAKERIDFAARYLIPYAPSWDGAHVTRLWSRVKDLHTWFPWYDRTRERRLASDPLEVERLHLSALGFLQSGEHYAKAYIRAAELQPGPLLASLTAPAMVMARRGDLIADHLARLDPSAAWTLRRLGPSLEDWRAALAEGLTTPEPASRAEPAPQPDAGAYILPVGAEGLEARVAGPRDGDLHLLLPGLPGDLAALVRDQAARQPRAKLIALSPPGCGGSDPFAYDDVGLDAVVEVMDAAFRQLAGALAPCHILAQGASAVIARLWRARRSWACDVELEAPPAWLQPDTPLPARPLLQPMTPRWDGAHLTAAWFQLRDLALYDTPPGCGTPVRREQAPDFDLFRLDRQFRSYVQGPQCADLLDQIVGHLRAERAGADV